MDLAIAMWARGSADTGTGRERELLKMVLIV
jgi:hypothetical protein